MSQPETILGPIASVGAFLVATLAFFTSLWRGSVGDQVRVATLAKRLKSVEDEVQTLRAIAASNAEKLEKIPVIAANVESLKTLVQAELKAMEKATDRLAAQVQVLIEAKLK